jgi:hypothetical protein
VSCRTLVVTLGQLRAHELTWTNFQENVLDQLGADLAVCVPDDEFFDPANPFYAGARFRWLVPDAADLADTFDRIQRSLGVSEDWRTLCDVQGSWLGRIAQSRQPGAAALLMVLRWFMLEHIRADRLTDVYDRFVITRSDLYYLCPHPPLAMLDPANLWLPDGEDYGGLTDKHLVVSAADLAASCCLIDDFLTRPQEMRAAMVDRRNWNLEQILDWHFDRRGLHSRVRRFPYVMFLVRSPDDPTAHSPGWYIDSVSMTVKYPTELWEAQRYQPLIRSAEDWRRYFASLDFVDQLPARLYTTHGTVLYVDEASGELRHGPLSHSPENVYFTGDTTHGRIVHRAGDETYAIACGAESCTSLGVRADWDGRSRRLAIFDRVPVARGFALDETLMTNNLVGLNAGDHYLTAELDGRIVLNRRKCFMWEHFRIVPNFGDVGPTSKPVEAQLPNRSPFEIETDGDVRSAERPRLSEEAEGLAAGLPNTHSSRADGQATIMLAIASARVFSSLGTEGDEATGIAVTDPRRGKDCLLTWDFVAPTGWHEIWAEYASASERPMTVQVDRDVLLQAGLSERTGGWLESHQTWRFQATVFLQAGLHRLSLTGGSAIPHIRAVLLFHVESPSDAPDADERHLSATTRTDEPRGKGLHARAPERVLVCVLAQTRAHQLTWPYFKKNVLDELGGDLALCIGVGDDYDYGNPFWQHAKYRWTSPEYEDFGDAFDLAQSCLAHGKSPITFDWRNIMAIKDQWLGGIKGPEAHPGSAGILIYFRWLLLHNLLVERVLDKYDRFVITRSDFLWTIPHPPLSVLSPADIWLPDGEFYGGLTDRHHVLSKADLPKVINLIDDILLRPDRLFARMSHHNGWNLEQYILFHLSEQGLLKRISLFPYVMFSVRGENDKTRWRGGDLNTDLGLIVKYGSELVSAQAYQGRIAMRGDWERLYAEGGSQFRRY